MQEATKDKNGIYTNKINNQFEKNEIYGLDGHCRILSNEDIDEALKIYASSVQERDEILTLAKKLGINCDKQA